MPNFAKIMQDRVANAYDKLLAPGGLTETITFRFITDTGTYDPIADEIVPTFDEESVACVVSKPTEDDAKDHDVLSTDAKLVVPGTKLTQDPEADIDYVLRAGEQWDVRKVVGVPGRAVVIVYIYRT